MKAKVLKYIRAAVFVAFIVGLVKCMDFVMMPSGYIRYIIHAVGNPDTEEGYDCVVLGASHGRSSIDPKYMIESGYAKNPLSLCIPGESVVNSYYLLKEACRNNNVKKVVLEMDYQYWTNDETRDSEFGDLFEYIQLPMSKVKLEYIGNELMDKDFRTVYFKKLAYTSDFGEVGNNIKTKLTKEYRNYDISAVKVCDANGPYMGRGFFYRENNNEEKPDFWVQEWSENDISNKVIQYFHKIVDYCNDNDIELVCITEPITTTAVVKGPSQYANSFFKDICSDNNVRYIDFTLLKSDVFDITDSDFCDWEGHMYGEAAERFSKIMSEVMVNDSKEYFCDSYKVKIDEIERNQP